MKCFLIPFLVLFLPLQMVSAQETTGSGMPTIEVDSFTRLENRLMKAFADQDRSTLDALLTADFELRTARSRGEITDRAEWLQAATSKYKIRSFHISRLTVRLLGNSAIVNFFYKQEASFGRDDLSGDFFIVDLWQKSNDWKLAARYSVGPRVIPKAAVNPKTKE